MKEFQVNLNQIQITGKEIVDISITIKDLEAKLRAIERKLAPSNRKIMQGVFKELFDEIHSEKEQCKSLGNTLLEIEKVYRDHENKIVGNAKTYGDIGGSDSQFSESSSLFNNIVKWLQEQLKLWQSSRDIEPYEVESIVFDSEGSYGGNQGSPMNQREEYKRKFLNILLNKYSSEEFGREDLYYYLEKLNSEGCGYVALVNTILVNYEGREKEFESTFGYPMYAENGDLNYDMLLVDFYSSMDNRVPYVGTRDEWRDYDIKYDGPKESYNYRSDTTGYGSTQLEQEYYIEQFMKKKGVKVDAKSNVQVDVKNFDTISKSGKQVIISFHNGNLYREDGSVFTTIQGGHSMTVTGVTSDGKFIVSSWGKRYYIDPKEKIELEYGNKKYTTSMSYSTVEYKQ